MGKWRSPGVAIWVWYKLTCTSPYAWVWIETQSNSVMGHHLNTATFKLRSNESDLAKKKCSFLYYFFFMDASIFDSIGVIISIRKSSVTADGKQQCSCRDLDVNKRLGAHLNTATFKLRSNESDLAKKNAVFCTTLFLWMFLLWRAVARWWQRKDTVSCNMKNLYAKVDSRFLLIN